MKSDSSQFENRGEIRSPDTPADLRRWLYQFRGSEVAPVISWQMPGVFSHVQVEQEVDVVRDTPKWNCRVQYEPKDGPLSTILFEIKHGSELDPIVEPDDPNFWKVERIQEPGKSRFRLRAISPTFGRSSVILRNGISPRATGRFDLPSVAPLGHGKVDKSVTLRTTDFGEEPPFEVEARGLTDSSSPNFGPGSKSHVRTWRFRSPDASWSLKFMDGSAHENQANFPEAGVRSTFIRNLAFEFNDDGEVLWYATGDSNALQSLVGSFSESLGPLWVSGSNGQPFPLERKNGSFVMPEREIIDSAREMLFFGRFRKDRLPLFFASIVDKSLPTSASSIVFALRHESRFRSSPPGRQVSSIEWLRSGKSHSETVATRTSDSIEAERARKFRMSGFAHSISDLSTIPAAKDSISNQSQSISDRSARFATNYIDDLILGSPARWNFYEFDHVEMNGFVRGSRDRDSNPESSDERLRRGMIAAAMTLAVLLCSRSRVIRDIRQTDDASTIRAG